MSKPKSTPQPPQGTGTRDASKRQPKLTPQAKEFHDEIKEREQRRELKQQKRAAAAEAPKSPARSTRQQVRGSYDAIQLGDDGKAEPIVKAAIADKAHDSLEEEAIEPTYTSMLARIAKDKQDRIDRRDAEEQARIDSGDYDELEFDTSQTPVKDGEEVDVTIMDSQSQAGTEKKDDATGSGQSSSSSDSVDDKLNKRNSAAAAKKSDGSSSEATENSDDSDGKPKTLFPEESSPGVMVDDASALLAQIGEISENYELPTILEDASPSIGIGLKPRIPETISIAGNSDESSDPPPMPAPVPRAASKIVSSAASKTNPSAASKPIPKEVTVKTSMSLFNPTYKLSKKASENVGTCNTAKAWFIKPLH